ncbi:YCF48-related protein [Zoogloea sp.]|uniref:WD40/YVTN/BNR-like repeat-containing protein n=1 Tax=Zoogloea sp. TaxID=49181 RepID=UPI00261FB51C|nr:YCF48-related protein [Zoogloea sp.]MDD3352049.1 YCF48-related protein [Zoogloea sp.]
MPIKKMAGVVTALLMASITPAGSALAFENPIHSPAIQTRLGATSALLGAATAGSRLVAVGLRGLIIYSDDAGASWKQAAVPTQVDLVAVSFPSDKKGWAVGHGGVVLNTTDGGATWARQLDGVQAAELAIKHYQASSHPNAAVLVEREQSLKAGGGTQPFLDVYFESESTGYVVGTFNRLFRTEDGGKTWTPWMERTENPGELHFYSIRGRDGSLYLTGEQGAVWRYDAAQQRFVLAATPYNGTLFGLVVPDANTVIAFGMRGSLYRSGDQGRTWEKASLGTPSGITGGSVLPGGEVLLITQAGAVTLSRDGGKSFQPIKTSRPMAYFGVAPTKDKRIVLVGAEGVRLESIQ